MQGCDPSAGTELEKNMDSPFSKKPANTSGFGNRVKFESCATVITVVILCWDLRRQVASQETRGCPALTPGSKEELFS